MRAEAFKSITNLTSIFVTIRVVKAEIEDTTWADDIWCEAFASITNFACIYVTITVEAARE